MWKNKKIAAVCVKQSSKDYFWLIPKELMHRYVFPFWLRILDLNTSMGLFNTDQMVGSHIHLCTRASPAFIWFWDFCPNFFVYLTALGDKKLDQDLSTMLFDQDFQGILDEVSICSNHRCDAFLDYMKLWDNFIFY